MDLKCVNCGEPWDIDYVYNEAPDDFKRTGCLIEKCPACKHKQVTTMDRQEKQNLQTIACLAEVLGDDCDALACMIEDHNL